MLHISGWDGNGMKIVKNKNFSRKNRDGGGDSAEMTRTSIFKYKICRGYELEEGISIQVHIRQTCGRALG